MCLTIRFLAVFAIATAALAGPEDDKLNRLVQEEFDELMRTSPTWASSRGDRRYDDKLADLSPEARAQRLEHAKRRRDAVRALNKREIQPALHTTLALLDYELAKRIHAAQYHPEQTPITQMWGPQRSLPQMASRQSFTKPKHFDDYITRLTLVGKYLDQTITNMRAGLEAGRTPPRVVVAPALAQTRIHAKPLKDATLHAMYPPYKEGDAVSPRAARAIQEVVIPAFARLVTFMEKEYIPGCRESIAAQDGVDGLDYYLHRLQVHTTMQLSANQIHEIGLEEVARIRKEMQDLIDKNKLPHSDNFADFLHFLRTDPQFYFTDKNELLDGYRAICKRIDAHLPRLFGKLPRLPYGVREMPGFIAASSPTAYYYSGNLKNGIPGYFVANTFRLDSRPKYEMVALTLHEAVPGHHLQISLAQELEGLPEWRSTLGYTAFGEGWALYAERLGMEMKGLYATPYDQFGRLSYEMWRAMRLVVDTGIHSRDWSRQRAVDYMLANSALTEQNVRKEVDRYIAWPGQATAYKMGEMSIRDMRGEAETKLGDKFDLRAFHDMVLEEGSIPLPLLLDRFTKWMEKHAR